jgi:transcriptional regulator with XRE-family HTH domain
MSPNRTLGEVIRELREQTDMSLRELARRIEVSAPFLSDIELSRRYPSKQNLEKIAEVLKVSVETLKDHDLRDALPDLKRLIENNPSLGIAFRTAVEEVREGIITTQELQRRIEGGAPKKRS